LTEFLAHVSEDKSRFHLLEDHLIGVAELASSMAAEFGSSGWARLAGLWHDLGKYSSEFQKMLRSKSGIDPDAHVETRPGKVDHSTIGAVRARESLGGPGCILAYPIAGHHAGLPDWSPVEIGKKSLSERLAGADRLPVIRAENIPPEIFAPASSFDKPPKGFDPALWIRMLFSCLVDADFLDTERFMDSGRSEARGGFPLVSALLDRFDTFMEKKTADALPTPVNALRLEVFHRCVEMSARPKGIFSLTVPTGGGKTLSSLAFALHHAVRHGLNRVIYVIPYTSIIEQTAAVFRDALGDDAVLEHHSNFDGGEEEETSRSRLATENWDAPVVVTTSVQFFESLFASRTSRCRKLHNIVGSVVVLDEAQLLPTDFLVPILRIIDELKRNYGTTFVLCTATQPAFKPIRTPSFRFDGLSGVDEIVNDPAALAERLRRVEVEIPENLKTPREWGDIAAALATYPSVLCIVNTRGDARALHAEMPPGTFHLSARMCGAHRSEVIAKIKERLLGGVPTRVVSTQLVEAGVDLDFPVVYRALAGLDSIAQAAGRCNREGRMAKLGKVVVFVPPRRSPPGHLRQAEEGGRQILAEPSADPLAPDRFERYFRELFWEKGDGLDRHRIVEDLDAWKGKGCEIAFRTASAKFRIIDESSMGSIVVRYGDGDSLIRLLEQKGPERWLLRKLQRFVVNLPKAEHAQLVREGGAIEAAPGVFAQVHSGQYDDTLGFCIDRSAVIPADELVV